MQVPSMLGLLWMQMLCEAFLKELKSVDNPRDHKVIDVWLIMLIYGNGGALQKSAEKILKSKILQLCIRETLFDQCIRGNTELVKVSSSVSCDDCRIVIYFFRV
jgi:Fanconi anemia group D2 protein